ncbi:MAG: PAS domain S-box protein [SAR324 cluster bacterium]|nr:PAS domain S-box protein [SAR324 cluster bacterium]
MNDEFCQIIGYSEEELIGQSTRIVYPTDEEFEQMSEKKYNQNQKYLLRSDEVRLKRKDGQIIYTIVKTSPLDKTNLSAGISFTVFDITERKQAENLRDLFFQYSTDLLCIIGFDRKFKQVNQAWTKKLGWNTREAD